MFVLREIHIRHNAQLTAASCFHYLERVSHPSPTVNNHIINDFRYNMHLLETGLEEVLMKDPKGQIYIREDYWEGPVAEGVFNEIAKLVLALETGKAVAVSESVMVQAWRASAMMVNGLLEEYQPAVDMLLETRIYVSVLAILVLVSPPVFRMLGFEAAFPVDKSFATEVVGGIPYSALLASLRKLARMHGRPLFVQDMTATVPNRADTGVLASMMSFLESD